jgi:hypothetical protein
MFFGAAYYRDVLRLLPQLNTVLLIGYFPENVSGKGIISGTYLGGNVM